MKKTTKPEFWISVYDNDTELVPNMPISANSIRRSGFYRYAVSDFSLSYI